MMMIKGIVLMTMATTFFTCSLLSGIPKEKDVQAITVTDIESIQDAKHAKEINIVFVGNEETKVTPEEYRLLLRVCMSECGGEYGEPLDGKIAVVETILNRSEIYRKSIEEVVYEPYQYSTSDNGEPDETVEQAVDIALRENIYPDDMIYFRTGNYHSFGEPYQQIGNHYFSLKESD